MQALDGTFKGRICCWTGKPLIMCEIRYFLYLTVVSVLCSLPPVFAASAEEIISESVMDHAVDTFPEQVEEKQQGFWDLL